MFPKYQQEWLELMNDTQRTVIVCSRDHGKSVFMHSWVVCLEFNISRTSISNALHFIEPKTDNGSHERH